MEQIVLYSCVAVLCILNLIATVIVLRRDDLERVQKFAQIVIVWFLPLIGAIGIWAFHRANDAPLKPQKGSGNDAKSDNSYISSGFGSSD